MFPKNTSPNKPRKEQLTGLNVAEGEHVDNIKKLIILLLLTDQK